MTAAAYAAPVLDGKILGQKYRLVHELGRGGFGRVYLAEHVTIESLRFAVKVLQPEHVGNWRFVQRFKREARSLAGLKSRHTVKVFDFGELGDGDPYIVMEYVEGETLASLLDRGHRFREADVHNFIAGVLRSLAEAHRAGIVHCDLKPANIIISIDPDTNGHTARVLDFGVAKLFRTDPGAQDRPRDAAGGPCTPQYAAPELLRGAPSPATDIYAAGLIAAELLDGRSPLSGLDAKLAAAAQLSEAPVSVGARCQASVMWPVIQRMIAKVPGQRFASAGQVVDALVDLPGDLPQEGDAIEFQNSILPNPALPNPGFEAPPSLDTLSVRRSLGSGEHMPRPTTTGGRGTETRAAKQLSRAYEMLAFVWRRNMTVALTVSAAFIVVAALVIFALAGPLDASDLTPLVAQASE